MGRNKQTVQVNRSEACEKSRKLKTEKIVEEFLPNLVDS